MQENEKMKFVTIFGLLIFIIGCGSPDSKEQSSTKMTEGKIFYVETINFGVDLQSCISNTLFNKWSDIDFKLNENAKEYSGSDSKNKHTFLNIESFTLTDTKRDIEKIVIKLKGDWTVKGTSYTIFRCKYDNGNWQVIGTIDDFIANDRPNDFISPNNLDVDELCDQIIKMIIKSSYK